VNRVRLGDLGDAEDIRDVQVTVLGFSRADAEFFVGQHGVERCPVGLGIDGHGFDAQFLGGPDDPEGDFPPVGDQDLREHEASRVGGDGE
jgi:hypothetical protein